MTTTLLVRRDQLADSRLVTREDAPLADGQIRVRVDSFSLTANNITYAAFGDAMQYWQFYPSGEESWGVIPVWGFGTVVQSLHPGVAVGERLYGYWPMGSSAVLEPRKLNAGSFSDGAAHRAELHPVYNQYQRCSADPFYTPESEDEQAVLRPLFATSWLIDDFLADNDFFGAKRIILSSASSKTAYGTAFQLHQRAGIEVIGLTSAGNREFCERLGCYHRVIAYEELDLIDAGTPCVYVDFAGNAKLRAAIHARFTELRFSCSVGGTHVEALGGARDLAGPRATLFFAPAQIKKRQADWGAAGLGEKLVAGWHAFQRKVTDASAPWLRVQRHEGSEAAQRAYQRMQAGDTDPALGHILTMR
ncbi:DUF2855 family protein [Caenimonas sedimenti]|uniref:DUF2855 family protein n=1 Tax=Caenimonas sedimenti TaxID=2596921 RepID=A0A562ZDT0_9BURK|nr:DUF2855 family protein [Caenimonas sedimenti]TWO63585.1 DUF2855 family protein [Caenimonas sedimenti]